MSTITFQTMTPIDLGEASQKGGFPLAGPLSLIFSSTKVTASDSAGVTVSMTSEDSAGYGKWEPCSSLAKVRKCNFIKWLNYGSGIVQTTGKEKGPEVNPALLSTSTISCTGESNELHHNSYLQATGNLAYSHDQYLKKTGAGFGIPIHEADISRYKRFFCVRNQRCAPIMVGRSGGALALAGFFVAGIPTPLRLATPFGIGERGLKEPTKEAAAMVATAQTRTEFIDTYWIIPEYETTPYGKVSFTRQDRRTFIALFKDSRLIWAGRQPVSDFTQGLKDPKSQKVGVKHTMSHEGIEEISIPQGGVNITPPSTPTITNIVTVQEVAHV